ncbi:EpsG family protein [Photobacterium phosphoreum]|uniref:EpsG family protein n=1 Tax=Photobacterium phosphoreum TaxID=659 RepID=UPI000D15E365|nr:EpsG family protein [Photobacterium phosphoreum]PSU55488.1 EpsG family protein [Photobacterium phosphoreum]
MLMYWLLFVVAVIGAWNEDNDNPQVLSLRRWPLMWGLIWCLLTLVIGYRYQVGGDWFSYIGYVDRAGNIDFYSLLMIGDPGYQVFNYIANMLGGGIYTVNLLSGAIFSYGLIVFCRTLPRPFLALTAAIPYLVVVVAMGYTRQSIALGLAMLALACLIHRNLLWFIVIALIAATFHKSAVLLIPLAVFVSNKNKFLSVIVVVATAIIAYIVLLQDDVGNLYTNYVLAEYQSQGAMIRILMCVVPAIIFLRYRVRVLINNKEKIILSIFSVLSIAAFIMLFVSSSSTAVDRVALYLLPLQLVIFSYFPEWAGNALSTNRKWVLVIILYYTCVLFVWLFFAKTAFAWIPYQFYPLTVL